MPARYINPSNIPQEFVNAITGHRHRVNGDISCTTLIDSAQIAVLKSEYTYNVDVADQVWALLGTALHEILESNTHYGQAKRAYDTIAYLTEFATTLPQVGDQTTAWVKTIIELLSRHARASYGHSRDEVLNEETLTGIASNGLTYSGTIDHYVKGSGLLRDYKSTSVWSYIFEGNNHSWEKQTNVYAHLLRTNGHPVSRIQIVRMFRDFSAKKRAISPDYPQASIMELDLPLWPEDRARAFIDERAEIHLKARGGGSMSCSDSEMWYTPGKWAVMKKGGIKATKIVEQEDTADAFIDAMPEGRAKLAYYKQERPGIHRRCLTFCPVALHCPQFNAILERMGSTMEKELRKIGYLQKPSTGAAVPS